MSTSRRNPSTMALGLLVACLTVAPSLADTQSLLTPTGDLFTVEEMHSVQGHASTALRSTIYRASGAVEVSILPKTDDDAFDTFPWLALDPDTKQPALVWSRHNGTDYDLYLAVHDGKEWGAPISLVASTADEIAAQAYTAPGEGLHIIWTSGRNVRGFSYGLFRTATGVPVRGPEYVRSFPTGRWADGNGKGGSFTEGGGDDPGTNPDDGMDDDLRGCFKNGMCKVSAPPTESAGVTGCEAFSVTVERGRLSCLLTRTDSGWSRQCFAVRGAKAGNRIDLKSAHQKLSATPCAP